MTEEEFVEVTLDSGTSGVPEVEESIEMPAETVGLEAEALLEDISLEDEIHSLEAQLAEADKKAAEYLDGWQRCQATFANFRKRTEAEQVTWRSVANSALLARLLPVADDLARAFQALPADLAGHAWLDGITLIQRKVAAILESENVNPIELEPGDAFDPLYHHAIFYQEIDGFEDGQIVAEVERGYILGDRVLRPSSVVVAKALVKTPQPIVEVTGEVVEAAPEADGETTTACCDEAECCCHCEES